MHAWIGTQSCWDVDANVVWAADRPAGAQRLSIISRTPDQVMLRQDSGEYACIAEDKVRYNLGELKEELQAAMGLNTEEEGSAMQVGDVGSVWQCNSGTQVVCCACGRHYACGRGAASLTAGLLVVAGLSFSLSAAAGLELIPPCLCPSAGAAPRY
jgi:hypothetical protein